MRRIAAALLALGAVAAVLGHRAEGASTYRVDAIFDTAKGIIPGQLVKIAGARVGEVEDVKLTPDYKARIQMSVDRRFAPFRSDAICQIQPEGLVGENFVQCNPGTPAAGELRPRGDEAPTVPVTRTSVPVNLSDLFNIWNFPVRQRLSIVVAELGIGVAGRGEDLNAVLRRANPTLAAARRTLGILNGQRAEIQSAVEASDHLVAELAARRERIRDFADQAAAVATRTANRRAELAEGIHRLPPLLRATRPALEDLDVLIRDGTPVLRDLRAAAPHLNRLLEGVPAFADAGVVTLRRLRPVADQGRTTVADAGPIVRKLRHFAAEARPTGRLVNELFVSLRNRGVVEGLLEFVYRATATTARFDDLSHVLPAHLLFLECSQFAETPTPGCNANYHGGSSVASAQATSQRRGRGAKRGQRPVPQLPFELPDAGRRSPRDRVDDLVRRAAGSVKGGDRDRSLEEMADYLLGR
jgi:virulence factor Mce-like protein